MSLWVDSLQKAKREAQDAHKFHAHLCESFLRQRSKITWPQLGNENSSYFHASLKKRMEENRITTDIDNQGAIVDNYAFVVDHFLSHFRSFMLSSSSASSSIRLDCIEFGNKLDFHQQFSLSDVKKARFNIHTVLPYLIDSNQGAFIKHCSIAHNVLIFQALLKGYTRKNIYSRCLLKIDLSKAYDTIDWDFLADFLKALCFPSKFINWIMGSIDSVRIVQKAFQDFCDTSGSAANKNKSRIYIGGVDETTKDTMEDSDKEKWQEAMNLEIESMHSNSVWTLEVIPENVRAIGCK
ncbi:uncharacterized protein LOC133779663 [Humulus lupulus]|uniref:uncharacterized protein LOC133779663 n=1 Tax=Humulus lupulus TaxID=3486 RepID=UPI002B416290|nr:uncharacterized protein LOC133779663 [Humulus lupulus]